MVSAFAVGHDVVQSLTALRERRAIQTAALAGAEAPADVLGGRRWRSAMLVRQVVS
jgi:hypothetical protein